MPTTHIVPMTERKYQMVPIDRIKVLNSRTRDKEQFDDNIRSIGAIGLLKPIVVNDRLVQKSGFYELVCGEGRYLAHKALKREVITAEIINCSRKTALLFSLVENIARITPNSIWFANEVKRMKDCGLPIKRISEIVGKDETYVSNYIQLIELGEERLLKGAEKGLFSMAFALIVAKSSSAAIQDVLMDAFDSGLITSHNAVKVRNLIEKRMRNRSPRHSRRKPATIPKLSIKDLRREITRAIREKEGFVRETSLKENQLFGLLDGLYELWKDTSFVDLLGKEGLPDRPTLDGTYTRKTVAGSEP